MPQPSLDTIANAGSGLLCGLKPSGRIDVYLGSPDEAADQPTAVQQRILAAFARGRGLGVLNLGARELSADLHPTLAYWREIGKNFVAKVCGRFDPTAPNTLIIPEPAADELAALTQAVPPMPGAELVTPELLDDLWTDMGEALAVAAAEFKDGVQGYLSEQDSVWNVVGRVCLHLAENKRDQSFPFAFMATYVHKVSRQSKAQHLPLGRALKEYSGAKNRKALLALISPLSRAAEQSSFIRELVDSGDIYHPLAWQAKEAHRFLCEIDHYEQAGLVVRIPDWWSASHRPRPEVSVSLGGKAPSTLGMDALLDFDVSVTLDGVKLSAQEIKALLAATEGLVLIKGKWIEVDPDKLGEVLEQWREVQGQASAGGISFGEAMRLLAGAPLGGANVGGEDDARPEWSRVIAGEWLSSRLDALRSPELRQEIEAGAGLQAVLRPYQKLGIEWLWTLRDLRLGGCLADDMGLGKTIQVLGVLSMCRGKKIDDSVAGTDLLIVPASLVNNWNLEIERFAPQLDVLIAHPSQISASRLAKLSKSELNAHDAVITTYGTVMRNKRLKAHRWRNVILDEAQATKNPSAKQTKAVKALDSSWRLALTGTPVENNLGDLWSIFDFLNPGLLGSAKDFRGLCKSMASGSIGSYAPLRRLLQPYILRRLKTDKNVISDLPDKMEVNAYCQLSQQQAALYAASVDELKLALKKLKGIQRRGTVLAFLMRFKQICNHPSQWLGDGTFETDASGKFSRLRELVESIASRQDKVLVFTQFRQMTAPLADLLAEVFGHRGHVLHGGTPVKKRQSLVNSFQADDDVPFMVLSLKAGGTGLNLTAASHVIHFDRWWNPAVENQATDRAFRIGQQKNVLVHKFRRAVVCRRSIRRCAPPRCHDRLPWPTDAQRVTRAQFEPNLTQKERMPEFLSDVLPLLPSGTTYEPADDLCSEPALQRDAPDRLQIAVEEFTAASRGGAYFETFNVNSKNFTEQSNGTTSWIAECNRLLDRCVAIASRQRKVGKVVASFELLFDLIDDAGSCEFDIVFFAEEGGVYEFGIQWQAVMAAWFECFARQTVRDGSYDQRVASIIEHGGQIAGEAHQQMARTVRNSRPPRTLG